MTIERKSLFRRVLDTYVERRRVAEQRRAEAYLAALGLIDRPDRT